LTGLLQAQISEQLKLHSEN